MQDPVLAVEGLEVCAIPGRNLDAGERANVEARFIVDKDDVGSAFRRTASSRRFETVGHASVGLEDLLTRQHRGRLDGGAKELRDVVAVVEHLPPLRRHGQSHTAQETETRHEPERRQPAADFARLGTPQRSDSPNRDGDAG
jgi:hypothetical protein